MPISAIMSFLQPRLQKDLPAVESKVGGFAIAIERKEGCVLRSRPEGSPDGTPYTDIGVDEHFEVTITSFGANPKYPKEITQKLLLTNALDKNHGYGQAGNTHFQRPGDAFTKVEVVEEYDDGRKYEGFGRTPPPAMVVWVQVHFRQADGSELSSKVSIASRPVQTDASA